MAKSFKEIGKKAEALIEKGKEADQKVQSCQARVVSSNSRVAAARRQLAAASETDEEGNPLGDVEQARAQLSMAENQLAASQRALSSARGDADCVRQQKNAHVQEIEKHNQVERSSLEKLRRLRAGAFGADSAALTEGMAERLNEAEDAKVALLRSMGMDAMPDYVAASGGSGVDTGWRGGEFGALDIAGQVHNYQGGASEVQALGSGIPAPVGGGLNDTRQDDLYEDNERPKILSRDIDSTIEDGALAIHRRTEAYRDNIRDQGITDQDVVDAMAQKFEAREKLRFASDLLGQEMGKLEVAQENMGQTEVGRTGTDKYLFGFGKQEYENTNAKVRERLQDCGVSNVRLEGVKEKYQEMIADSVEEMCESYPELKGYVGAIRAEDLPKGVFACAGPVMTKEGFSTEMQVNRELFGKGGLESKIINMEIPNWSGESWLAGEGPKAVIKHEMGHLLHLRMIAEQERVEIGDTNMSDFRRVQNLYDRNAIAVTICYEAMKENGIHPNDMARNISVYGAHDAGECFAEAISEYETRKHPRPFAVTVHGKYERRMKQNDYDAT